MASNKPAITTTQAVIGYASMIVVFSLLAIVSTTNIGFFCGFYGALTGMGLSWGSIGYATLSQVGFSAYQYIVERFILLNALYGGEAAQPSERLKSEQLLSSHFSRLIMNIMTIILATVIAKIFSSIGLGIYLGLFLLFGSQFFASLVVCGLIAMTGLGLAYAFYAGNGEHHLMFQGMKLSDVLLMSLAVTASSFLGFMFPSDVRILQMPSFLQNIFRMPKFMNTIMSYVAPGFRFLKPTTKLTGTEFASYLVLGLITVGNLIRPWLPSFSQASSLKNEGPNKFLKILGGGGFPSRDPNQSVDAHFLKFSRKDEERDRNPIDEIRKRAVLDV